MSGEAVCVFSAGEPMKRKFINNFTAAAFRAFKNFGTGSERNCNTELIRTE